MGERDLRTEGQIDILIKNFDVCLRSFDENVPFDIRQRKCHVRTIVSVR